MHTFAVWAATRFVPTGELRRERSFRVGACGRRPLESADPGACVWVCIRECLIYGLSRYLGTGAEDEEVFQEVPGNGGFMEEK